MLCEHCNKNKATVHYEQVINGVRTEKHLCAACAEELDMGGLFDTGNLFAPLFAPAVSARKARSCPVCGYSEREFLDTQFLGCPDCYNAFSDIIEPMLQRVHGSVTHKGTRLVGGDFDEKAKPLSEIEKLKLQLDEAVKKQEYEKAAKLRDKIKELSNGNK